MLRFDEACGIGKGEVAEFVDDAVPGVEPLELPRLEPVEFPELLDWLPSCAPASFEASRTAKVPPTAATAAPVTTPTAAQAIAVILGVLLPIEAPLITP